MATKKSGRRKGISASEKRAQISARNKQAKSDLARLKKVGLYKGDARKKPTRHGLAQIKIYKDVLSGKAKVISAPSRSKAKTYSETYKTKFRRIVVPVKPGEKVFYSKKSDTLFSYRTEYGHKVKRIFPKRAMTIAGLDNLPQGKNIRYALPIGTGGTMERVTFDELKAFANRYAKSTAWRAYLEIHEILDGDDDDGDDE